MRYGYKEGNPFLTDAGWYRTKRIISECEAEDFPTVGVPALTN